MENMQGMCKCAHHTAVPFLIVVLGVTFMMGYNGMLTWDSVNVVWPLVVIAIGIAKLIDKLSVCKCSGKEICNHCC